MTPETLEQLLAEVRLQRDNLIRNLGNVGWLDMRVTLQWDDLGGDDFVTVQFTEDPDDDDRNTVEVMTESGETVYRGPLDFTDNIIGRAGKALLG